MGVVGGKKLTPAEAHRDVILHAYVYRKVDPALAQGLDEWNSAMTGGNIPSACTDGIRVGGSEGPIRQVDKPGAEPKNMTKNQRKLFYRLKREREGKGEEDF